MTNIVLTCYILQKFLHVVDNDESLLDKMDRELIEQHDNTRNTQQNKYANRLDCNIRDQIVNHMSADYENK